MDCPWVKAEDESQLLQAAKSLELWAPNDSLELLAQVQGLPNRTANGRRHFEGIHLIGGIV